MLWGITPEQLNKVLGVPLIGNNAKEWTLPALQQRAKIRFSGNAGRFSAKIRSRIAGAMPVEMIVYTTGKNQQIKRITVIYANKGDTGKRYSSRKKEDKRNIDSTLSKVLGQSKRNSFQSGNLRVKADMWHSNCADIFLEVNKNDFTMLHLIPPGSGKKASGSEEKDYSGHVKRNKFGDVFIPDVPMVDQGPKGYCVPATVERVFLYYGIAIDMHHLADIGNSSSEDGTDTGQMLKDITRIRRRAGLKMEQNKSLSIKTVARYIDKGYPLFWIMYSTPGLNEVYSFSRKNRSQAKTPDEWKRMLKKISIPADNEGPHMCLIIGYNRETNEIAVSNSWGDDHIAPLWIPMKAASKVSREVLVFIP